MPTPIFIPPPPPFHAACLAEPAACPPPLGARNPEPETASGSAEHETRNSEPETAAAPFAARIPRGKRDRWTPYKGARARSTVFTPELVTEILETIERFGFTEAEAAVHCHVSTSTLDRWKREDPELEDFLVEARLEFASNQIHTISSFTRRDGQNDPQGAKWLLERSDPDRWGRPSARRNAAAQQPETRNAEPETASKKPPKPNTPEYRGGGQWDNGCGAHWASWDYVEEEPWPRNLSTCTFTPGRQKFYAIYHLVSAYYRDQPKFRDQPSVDPESEQGKRGWESFFSTQETYFSLPKEQRIPYLHALFERQYEKVLTPEERAAADLAARGPCASRESSPSPSSSSSPSSPNPFSFPGNPRPFFPTNENTTPTQNVQKCAESRPTADPRLMSGQWVSTPVVIVSPGTPDAGFAPLSSFASSSSPSFQNPCTLSSESPSFLATNENATPTQNAQFFAEIRPTPEPVSCENSPSAPSSCPSSSSCSKSPTPAPVSATNENATPTQNVQKCAETTAATPARGTPTPALQTAADAAATPAPGTQTGSAPATRNSELETRNSPPRPQPPTAYKRPLFKVKRRAISPTNPAWPQYQAALQREAMEEKLAEMEQLQAQGKPADSTHEAALAQYHELARQEQERLNRENEAFFNRPDDQDEEPVTDCF